MGMGLEVVECPGESGPSVDDDFVSAGSVPDGGGATAPTPLAAGMFAVEADDDAVRGSVASLIILESASESASKLIAGSGFPLCNVTNRDPVFPSSDTCLRITRFL